MQMQQDNIFYLYIFLIPTHFHNYPFSLGEKKIAGRNVKSQLFTFKIIFPNSGGDGSLTVKLCKPQKARLLQNVAKFYSINYSFRKNM